MASTKIPKESVYDEDGNALELGDKFYAPATELLILLPNSDNWVKGDEFPVIDVPNLTPVYSDLGDDFIPVSDNDVTGFGTGRVS
jgi:hypothetical protein